MNNIFNNRTKKIIAFLLVGFFVFSFLHSELGLLNCDTNNHSTHDYCQIVKNTNTQSKILQQTVPKLELNKDFCIHCFEESEAQATQNSIGTTDHNLKAKTSTDLYLFNNTFLI